MSPTLRATNIELYDVSTSGATDFNQSCSTSFMACSVTDGINIYKNLLQNNNTLNGIISMLASGDIAVGSITTSIGNISSLSGSIQTRDGTVEGGNMDHFKISLALRSNL